MDESDDDDECGQRREAPLIDLSTPSANDVSPVNLCSVPKRLDTSLSKLDLSEFYFRGMSLELPRFPSGGFEPLNTLSIQTTSLWCVSVKL